MVGETIENITKGTRRLECDELYPIVSEKFKISSIENIREKLEDDLIIHTQLKNGGSLVIDPFTNDSYEDIIGLIIDIVQERSRERGVEFWVNITGGTNLMSAAAAAGATLTRSNSYYVVGKKGEIGRVIKLPWHAHMHKDLKPVRIAILRHLKGGPLFNTEILDRLIDKRKNEGVSYNMSPRKLTYDMKELESRGYVKRNTQGRNMENRLTTWGKIAIRLMDP